MSFLNLDSCVLDLPTGSPVVDGFCYSEDWSQTALLNSNARTSTFIDGHLWALPREPLGAVGNFHNKASAHETAQDQYCEHLNLQAPLSGSVYEFILGTFARP